MSTVRSTRFWIGPLGAPGDNHLLTVPDGHVWLLKYLVLTNNAAVSLTVFLYALEALTGTSARIIPQQVIPANASVALAPWIALDAGDELHSVSDQSPAPMYLAGADLTT